MERDRYDLVNHFICSFNHWNCRSGKSVLLLQIIEALLVLHVTAAVKIQHSLRAPRRAGPKTF